MKTTTPQHRQMVDALRDEFEPWIAGHSVAAWFDWDVAADNALAALGLDDLDAAVERLAAFLNLKDEDDPRGALEAALSATATPSTGGESTDA